MKVRIQMTVDVDTEAWTLNYGVAGMREIRADVQEHASNAITEHYRDLGLLAAPVVYQGG